ncbi:hypothetical protein SPFM12_00124 [Salmonella phage SPFM12]|nr:hypothetical protein SPFM12_00124 [Salmonella phage SPFM12]
MVKEGHIKYQPASLAEDAFALSELTISREDGDSGEDTDEEVLAFVNADLIAAGKTRLDSSNIIGAKAVTADQAEWTITATAESANFTGEKELHYTFGAVADYSPADSGDTRNSKLALFNAANSGLSSPLTSADVTPQTYYKETTMAVISAKDQLVQPTLLPY